MKRERQMVGFVLAILVAAGLPGVIGCEGDNPVSSVVGLGDSFTGTDPDAGKGDVVTMTGDLPPADLVQIGFAGEDLEFWPYTGASFDGAPVDPINLVFVGKADPVRIRAALTSLDGDRTAFGFPPVAPFDGVWSDAIGDVQTTYADGDGWAGSVIQLQLGTYEPIRVHLRLFPTHSPYGDGGGWTLGAAHFELLIPGTTNHQVLSWEIAERVVVADLVRSGLLEPTLPLMPTGSINAAPSFRDIPPYIYNELPVELRGLIGGPLGDVTDAVPLASDGQGTVLNLAVEAPITPGTFTQTLHVDFNLVVPKPFCSDGPYDWVLVTGPVDFQETVEITADGGYAYHSGYQGRLEVIPMDITVSPPVPVAAPFQGVVSGTQDGAAGPGFTRVMAIDRRVAPQKGGAEITSTRLKVATTGKNTYRRQSHCLDGTS